jgi:hypothetical protein
MKPEWWGCTTGSRGEVPGERKLVIRDDDDDNNIMKYYYLRAV